MKLWKVENRETGIRIDQSIFNHEGRKMTQRRGGKDEIVKVENRETRNRLLDLIQIVSVKCSLGTQWALPAITSAPAVAGFWATPGS